MQSDCVPSIPAGNRIAGGAEVAAKRERNLWKKHIDKLSES